MIRFSFLSIPLLLCALIGTLSGCVTHFPVEEYTLARAAVESAKDADAARYAPTLWYKAEEAYLLGQRAYKERRYNSARSSFLDAKYNAERAENSARLARFQTGDAVP